MADQDPLRQLYPNHNQLLQNVLPSSEPGRVAPPMPTSFALPHPLITAAAAPSINSALPRNHRRVSMQAQQQYIPSTGTYNGYPGYANRPYVPINTYNPYNTFGQPLTQLPQFQNPVIIAAAESSRNAFDQIYSVVQSFTAISTMLESTYTAMNLSFQALLGVAENFSRLKVFITKLYSAIVSVKLARWFLIKIMHLLKMVMGNKRLNDEENVWTHLSTLSGNVDPSPERTWPLVVFTGLLASAPFFVYKLLASGTPSPINEVPVQNNKLVFRALTDWNNYSLANTISVVKGQNYFTTNKRIMSSTRNGWLLVEDSNGQKGYVPPNVFFKTSRKVNTQLQPKTPEMLNLRYQVLPVNQNDVIHEQVQPLSTIVPIPVMHDNPIIPLQTLVDSDELENR